jgi:uncharacterized protein with HEPN domain
MKEDVKNDLRNLLAVIYDINRNIGGHEKFEDYKSNLKLQEFVVGSFKIINKLLDRIVYLDSTIDTSEVKNFKKFIDHVINEYKFLPDGPNHELVWEVITIHLPKFESELESILKKQ